MFGTNPIRKQELRTDGQLWVQEIFRTIQGEGPLAGRPAVFIRLAGCNLACKFCDTEFESGKWLHWKTVAQEAAALAPGRWPEALFVITGGEPLRQDIRELVDCLLQYYGEVQIETAGTLWLHGLNADARLVVSPKTGKLNSDIERVARAYKYILRAGQIDPADGLPDRTPTEVMGKVARPPQIIQTGRRAHDTVIYVQPCDDHDANSNAANLRAAVKSSLEFGYRISLQQHKLLELP